MCMLRTQQLRGYYRDPILLQLRRSADIGDKVDDPWFTGYATTPRWLRLARSGVGIRSVADGFSLQGPEDEVLASIFDGICANRDDIMANGGQSLLTIPQHGEGNEAIDAVNRVQVGAELLREL